MIVSVHLADVGVAAMARAVRRGTHGIDGLVSGAVVVTTPLSRRLLPAVAMGRVGMFGFWEEEAVLYGFLERHPLGDVLAGGWHMRAQPVRLIGRWEGIERLLGPEVAMDDDEPAAALTLGRLRLSQAGRFVRAAARAERDALANPEMAASMGLARPPRLVSTFSIWRTTGAMRAYAAGAGRPGHAQAARAHAARPFHHESGFLRLRPLAVWGHAPWWPGLAALELPHGRDRLQRVGP